MPTCMLLDGTKYAPSLRHLDNILASMFLMFDCSLQGRLVYHQHLASPCRNVFRTGSAKSSCMEQALFTVSFYMLSMFVLYKARHIDRTPCLICLVKSQPSQEMQVEAVGALFGQKVLLYQTYPDIYHTALCFFFSF